MIKTAIFGVGNVASALVQGVGHCRKFGADAISVLFPDIAGHRPEDIEFVAAFDIDRRKVGRPLSEAVFSLPNNTATFDDAADFGGVIVSAGRILDGISTPIRNETADRSFLPIETGEGTREEIVATLRASGAEVAISFMPVGSQQATEFYAECAIEAGVAFVNAIPVFIASDPTWAARFAAAGLPVLGDDFKGQIGATILHRALVDLFKFREAEVDRSYQLNVGGNTDFINMLEEERLASKRLSKTESVQSASRSRFADRNIRIGPSDFVPWLNDRKVAFVRLEGRLFGGAPINVEIRLDVEDSPNAAVMALAAIRLARVARDRGLSGAIPDLCAFLFKHPPVQMEDREAIRRIQAFIEAPAD
ncbi:MAG: inositol-3-phosphate synthase [Siculibacillus sp.]